MRSYKILAIPAIEHAKLGHDIELLPAVQTLREQWQQQSAQVQGPYLALIRQIIQKIETGHSPEKVRLVHANLIGLAPLLEHLHQSKHPSETDKFHDILSACDISKMAQLLKGRQMPDETVIDTVIKACHWEADKTEHPNNPYSYDTANINGTFIDVLVALLETPEYPVSGSAGEVPPSKLIALAQNLIDLPDNDFMVTRYGIPDRTLAYKERNNRSYQRVQTHFQTYQAMDAAVGQALAKAGVPNKKINFACFSNGPQHRSGTTFKLATNLIFAWNTEKRAFPALSKPPKYSCWDMDLDGNHSVTKDLVTGMDTDQAHIYKTFYTTKILEICATLDTRSPLYVQLTTFNANINAAETNHDLLTVLEELDTHFEDVDITPENMQALTELYQLIQFMQVHKLHSGHTLRQDGSHFPQILGDIPTEKLLTDIKELQGKSPEEKMAVLNTYIDQENDIRKGIEEQPDMPDHDFHMANANARVNTLEIFKALAEAPDQMGWERFILSNFGKTNPKDPNALLREALSGIYFMELCGVNKEGFSFSFLTEAKNVLETMPAFLELISQDPELTTLFSTTFSQQLLIGPSDFSKEESSPSGLIQLVQGAHRNIAAASNIPITFELGIGTHPQRCSTPLVGAADFIACLGELATRVTTRTYQGLDQQLLASVELATMEHLRIVTAKLLATHHHPNEKERSTAELEQKTLQTQLKTSDYYKQFFEGHMFRKKTQLKIDDILRTFDITIHHYMQMVYNAFYTEEKSLSPGSVRPANRPTPTQERTLLERVRAIGKARVEDLNQLPTSGIAAAKWLFYMYGQEAQTLITLLKEPGENRLLWQNWVYINAMIGEMEPEYIRAKIEDPKFTEKITASLQPLKPRQAKGSGDPEKEFAHITDIVIASAKELYSDIAIQLTDTKQTLARINAAIGYTPTQPSPDPPKSLPAKERERLTLLSVPSKCG